MSNDDVFVTLFPVAAPAAENDSEDSSQSRDAVWMSSVPTTTGKTPLTGLTSHTPLNGRQSWRAMTTFSSSEEDDEIIGEEDVSRASSKMQAQLRRRQQQHTSVQKGLSASPCWRTSHTASDAIEFLQHPHMKLVPLLRPTKTSSKNGPPAKRQCLVFQEQRNQADVRPTDDTASCNSLDNFIVSERLSPAYDRTSSHSEIEGEAEVDDTDPWPEKLVANSFVGVQYGASNRFGLYRVCEDGRHLEHYTSIPGATDQSADDESDCSAHTADNDTSEAKESLVFEASGQREDARNLMVLGPLEVTHILPKHKRDLVRLPAPLPALVAFRRTPGSPRFQQSHGKEGSSQAAARRALLEVRNMHKLSIEEAFLRYLSALCSLAVDPEFVQAWQQDELVRNAYDRVTTVLEDKERFCISSATWHQNFLAALDAYPCLELIGALDGVRCDACRRTHAATSCRVRLSGHIYDRASFAPLVDPTEFELDFQLGRVCVKRATLYHKFHHFPRALFNICHAKVRSVKERVKKTNREGEGGRVSLRLLAALFLFCVPSFFA